jgi:hypothetical protein
VDGAARDLEHVAGVQLALLAVHTRGECPLEHLEALVLSRMEVLRRRGSARPPGPFDLERLRLMPDDPN